MGIAGSGFPEYERPPVVEVALSFQFKPLELLRSAHIGLLWQTLRKQGFSRVEDHGSLDSTYEEFPPLPTSRVGIRFQTFDDAPPLPRVWFLNDAQNELIQLQKDRLSVNWRQGAGTAPYPRYVHILERFKFASNVLHEFAQAERLGIISPNQCEITYVNHITAEQNWARLSDLSQVVTVWQNRYSDDYLHDPEDVMFAARYRMGNPESPKGRLHVTVQPAFRRSDSRPIFSITLTARGQPDPATMDGVFNLLDDQHKWIIFGFTSITTTQLHEFWGKKNG